MKNTPQAVICLQFLMICAIIIINTKTLTTIRKEHKTMDIALIIILLIKSLMTWFKKDYTEE